MTGAAVAPGSVRIFDTTLRDGEQAPGAGLTAVVPGLPVPSGAL